MARAPIFGVSGYVVRDGALLLMRRSAAKAYGVGAWEAPAGKAEAGESSEAAVRREVLEEAGLAVAVRAPFDTWHLPATADAPALIGVAFVCDWRAGAVALSDEHDAFRWVPIAEAPAFPVMGVLAPMLRRFAALVG